MRHHSIWSVRHAHRAAAKAIKIEIYARITVPASTLMLLLADEARDVCELS